MQTQRKNYGGPDVFRLAAALLVVAIHTSPLASVNGEADFFFTRVLARIAVPFFFMVTGHFVLSGLFSEDRQKYDRCVGKVRRYLLRLLLLYAASIVLYLPLGLYAGHYRGLTLPGLLRMLIFDGTFYHLWYFPACILGVLLLLLMSRFLKLRTAVILSGLLYLIGLFGDSYFGFIEKIPVLSTVYEGMFQLFTYTRNGLFLAPMFLMLGILAGNRSDRAENSYGETFAGTGSPAQYEEVFVGTGSPAQYEEVFVGTGSPAGNEVSVYNAWNKADNQLLQIVFLVLSFCAMTVEAFLLRQFELQRHDSMYFFLIPVSFFLYRCLLAVPAASRKPLRTASTWIYILHPAFIVVVRGIAKLLHLTGLLVDNSPVHYLAVAVLSVSAGLFLSWLETLLRRRAGRNSEADVSSPALQASRAADGEPDILDPASQTCGTAAGRSDISNPAFQACKTTAGRPDISNPAFQACKTAAGRPNIPNSASPISRTADGGPETLPCRPGTERAWIQLDREALAHNVRFLQSRLPAGCHLMPAVKANAYGHGAELIAGELNRLGVHDFCVACLSEGIELREAGINGQILILGYTHPSRFSLLSRYRLTQTVLDLDYAKQMQAFGGKLHVHIAVDTGMHRLGIRCEDWEDILSVYRMQNLVVDGIFTHLAACDSSEPLCRSFTESQINAFYQVIDSLEEAGCPCHGLHLLSSYGIANYSDAAADYVRPGIALYGLLSSEEDSLHVLRADKTDGSVPSLRPVLSLYARVSSVRTLQPGESVGYGMAFTADRSMKVAVLSVGYADGLPRSLSQRNGRVLINGHSAPVLGRICMDQTLVDVSGISQIAQGDVAVLIGRSGTDEITVGELALRCDTITNEILSRLGARLERILLTDPARDLC